ncbi:XrtA system polysaccharide chain length determinant [Rivibacter subsaxonicus]|uniref:Polysaccharide chain length determinant protein (PEP-CTERM system associated) n=1 Tax=Rivibacter subsaxonicus TaxID=457575 RepID=A0A4Q7VVZ5_9BURK|nr:XrtA system polysaccharide chain length determinant [Rivibacter subsaxonicus]RZU00773.1 polysaccharide chain length determinant protein (PEP-CTERM system associated) [Rivibacter subsaxonicus]
MTTTSHDGLLGAGRALLHGVWQRRWLAVAVAWSVALLAAIIIPLVPQRYEASARFYVDTQTVLKPLMAGLALQPDFDQQLRMMARTLITRPNVERVLQRPEFALLGAEAADRERVIDRVMSQLKLTPADSGNIYTISYRDADPQRAQRVVSAIIDLFLEQSSGEKKRDSEDASRFIDEQIRAHELKLIEAESRLKEFKLRNFGMSGVSDKDYFTRISAMQDSLNKLRADLRAAEQARDAYRRELAAENPQLPTASDADGAIAAQRKQLDDLLRRYTDQHPDVVFARQTLVELEAKQRAELGRDGLSSKGAAATSPVYQRIRVALAETEAAVANLRGRVGAEQQLLDQVRAAAGRVPQIEADFAQLNRDYEVIRKNYEQLVARRESASLGAKLEQSSRLADFRVVEPPKVSRSAVAPNRLQLALLALAATLVAALLAPHILERLRPSFGDARSLREATGRPVVGNLPLVMAAGDEQLLRREKFKLGGIALLLLALQASWVIWIAARSSMT